MVEKSANHLKSHALDLTVALDAIGQAQCIGRDFTQADFTRGLCFGKSIGDLDDHCMFICVFHHQP